MAREESALSSRLEAAAVALTGGQGSADALAVLRALGYDDGDADAADERARMLRAGALFRRLFRLSVPDAPGLVFFGGEADPAVLGPHNLGLPAGSFAGSGLETRRAFESCVGEGIEYLSQFARPADRLERGSIAAFATGLDPASIRFVDGVLAACGLPADHPIEWSAVRRLGDGAAAWFPADLCLRRSQPDFVPPLKLSTGCAAGRTQDAAILRGLLELVERDALALWWRGGRRGRAIPPESQAEQEAARLLVRLRRDQDARRTVLLDITTDVGVPVVAAFSARADGSGFALGLGARTTLSEAARAAIFELCQSELSLHLIAAKQREPDVVLNAGDRRQIERATRLRAESCVLLQPGAVDPPTPPALTGDPIETITGILVRHGIVAYTLDLTRPVFGVPVVRMIAPGLQYDPCDVVGERLSRAIAETGGGAQYTGGIALL